MPKIIRVEGTGKEQQSNANIPLSVAGSAGAGQIAMGQAQVQFGREYPGAVQRVGAARTAAQGISILGDAMVRAGERAANAVQVHRKVGDAAEAFQQQKQAKQLETQQGTLLGDALYKTFYGDVEKIAKDIREKAARGLTDPKVRKDFLNLFDEYTVGQLYVARKDQLRQQTQYGQENLKKALGGLVKQGASDDFSQAGYYEQNGLSLLDEAELGGLISADGRKAIEKDFVETLRTGIIQSVIRKDPKAAAIILNTTPEELKISENTYDHLLEILDATQKGDEYLLNKAQKTQLIDGLVEEVVTFEQMRLKIVTGTANLRDIVEQKGLIPDNQYKALVNIYDQKVEAEQAEQIRMEIIATDIANGRDLSGYTSKDINDFYSQSIKKIEDDKGRPLSLAEKAEVANAMGREVTSFAKELNRKIKSNNPEKVADALSAITYLEDLGSEAITEGMDADAEKQITAIETLVVDGGMSIPEALQKIEQDKLKPESTELEKLRMKEFKKSDKFKTFKDVVETTSSNLPGAESIIGDNYAQSHITDQFYEAAQDHYKQYGDMDAALSYASKKLSKGYGTTIMTGKREYVFQPIEKHYPQYKPNDLKYYLSLEVRDILPEGVTDRSLRLRAVPETFDPKNPKWYVTYPNADGDEVPLMHPNTMVPVQWAPAKDVESLKKLEESLK